MDSGEGFELIVELHLDGEVLVGQVPAFLLLSLENPAFFARNEEGLSRPRPRKKKETVDLEPDEKTLHAVPVSVVPNLHHPPAVSREDLERPRHFSDGDDRRVVSLERVDFLLSRCYRR